MPTVSIKQAIRPNNFWIHLVSIPNSPEDRSSYSSETSVPIHGTTGCVITQETTIWGNTFLNTANQMVLTLITLHLCIVLGTDGIVTGLYYCSYLYQKDERALLGNLQNNKFCFIPVIINKLPLTTPVLASPPLPSVSMLQRIKKATKNLYIIRVGCSGTDNRTGDTDSMV